MKKVLILMGAVCALSFASCKKSYTCECTTPTGGHISNTSQVTAKNEADALVECKKSEEGMNGYLTCFLQ